MATYLVELICIDKKTVEQVRAKFEQAWLAQYPWPKQIIHKPDNDFIAGALEQLMQAIRCKAARGSAKNAQSKLTCERMDQTVGNVLKTLLHSSRLRNMVDARDIVDDALATSMHAMRCYVTTALGIARSFSLRERYVSQRSFGCRLDDHIKSSPAVDSGEPAQAEPEWSRREPA